MMEECQEIQRKRVYEMETTCVEMKERMKEKEKERMSERMNERMNERMKEREGKRWSLNNKYHDCNFKKYTVIDQDHVIDT